MYEQDSIPDLQNKIKILEERISELENRQSEQQFAEKNLLETEQRYRSFIEQTTDAVFCYEFMPPVSIKLPIEEQIKRFYSAVLVECNNVCIRSYGKGYKREDVIGRKLTDLFGTSTGSLDNLFKTLIRNNYHIENGEGTEILPDGSKRYYLNNGYGVIKDEKLLRVWGTFRDVTEQKQIIQELEESKEKYKTVFEDAPITLWEEDFSQVKQYIDALKASGIENFEHYFKSNPEEINVILRKIDIISINNAAINLYEAESKKELIDNLPLTFTEKAVSDFTEQLIALIYGKHSYEKESELKTITGKVKIVSMKWVLSSEHETTWRRILISMTDMTKINKTHYLLRIQRDISRQFSTFSKIDTACFQLLKELTQIEAIDSGGVYLIDQETDDLDLIAHLGISDDFMNISSHYDADSPQGKLLLTGKILYSSFSETEIPMDDIRKNEGIKSLTIIPIKHDNKIIAGLIIASHTHDVIPDSSRTIIESISGMIGSYIVRIKAENALKESEERYHMLLHNIPYVTWISDSEGNTVFISENVKDIYGFIPEEIYKNSKHYFFGRIHPEDIEKVQTAWKEFFNTDKAFNLEYRIKRKDGGWIWLHDRSVNTYFKKGKQYAYGLFADITKEKQMEEQLRQSEKLQAIGQLAGGIAHDFNNQLTGILTYAELVKSLIPENSEISSYIQNIITCVQHSSNLTSQLLVFSRKGNFQSVEIDLHSTIMEIINILQHSIDKKIRIEKKLNAHSHSISGDPSQIQNAILNIALNSRDAIHGSGIISFMTENMDLDSEKIKEIPLNINPGTYILLTIRDNGVGMDTEVLNRIFEPFFTTKKKGKGTGMGMAAVYGTVKNHKGGIRITSRPEEGTVARIYFPVINAVIKKKKPLTQKLDEIKREEHILIADDEEAIRESIGIILTHLGYKIYLCQNGAEALQYYKQNWEKIDLVILDMIMPEMSGEETFLKMKKINPDVKVLFISGYSSVEETKNMYQAGISGFIHKPFSLHEISEQIDLIL